MRISVCIFAHNEERLLPRCLGALSAAAAGADYAVHVVENGSKDRTAQVARALAAADPRMRVHQLPIGDKANAWNDYVHRLSGEADLHVFLDGDVRPCEGAFAELAKALAAEPDAYAAAALPATGRSRRAWATRFFEEHFISGNLYALSGAAMTALRLRNIQMPIGFIGEDGLISYLMLTDLNGGADDGHRRRIAISPDAHFEFDSLGFNRRDAALYWRRLKRYSLRHFQNELLYARLKAEGVGAMPERIETIYSAEALARLAPRAGMIDALIDRRVLRELRSI